jgi:ferredoxin-nitrite reductase
MARVIERPRAQRTLEIPPWEQVLRRNSIERLKREKFPLDVIRDLPRLIEMGYEAIPEEDIVRLQWWGLYHDKPKVGYFMMRVKIANGLLRPRQLRALGELSNRWGRGYGELTTRQNVQLHWIRLQDLPEVLAFLRDHDLTTAGGCGDTVRNITGCPVAGIDSEERFDVQPLIRRFAEFFYGNREYSDLPRKHKITISACPYQCNGPEFHCIALIGAFKEGRPGFAVRIGGGLASTPRISRDLGVFVPMEEALDVVRAIIDCWKENRRYRVSRVKARLKFMVDDYGVDAYRRMVEARLGRALEDFQAPLPIGETDHLGIHPQRQKGFVYIGFPVRVGWMTGHQMLRVADLLEEVGADFRITRQQNFILGNVAEAKVDEVVRRMEEMGFPLNTNRIWGRSIACTGEPFCNYSVTETKTKLKEILERLEARFGEAVAELRIHLDGCPHACGQHWLGDIGLQGTTARREAGSGEKIQAYDLILRGGLGAEARIGRPLLRRVPSEEVPLYVERLVTAWLRERASRHGAPYTFRDFLNERRDEELVAIAEGRP